MRMTVKAAFAAFFFACCAFAFMQSANAQGVTRICVESTGANGSNNCVDASTTNPFPVTAPSLPLPSGAATSANQPTNAAQGSTTSGQTGTLGMGAVTTAAPSYTNGQTDPLSLNPSGGLRVDGSAVTQPVTGNTGSFNISVPINPTLTASSAYASGNALGGLQTVAFFRTTAQPSGLLNNFFVSSKQGITSPITLYIFNANPNSVGSTCTDKTAFSLATADVSKLIAIVPPVLTPAVIGVGTTVTMASQQTPVSVKNNDGTVTTNLYVCPVVGGTPTFTSTTDLTFKLAGVQD